MGAGKDWGGLRDAPHVGPHVGTYPKSHRQSCSHRPAPVRPDPAPVGEEAALRRLASALRSGPATAGPATVHHPHAGIRTGQSSLSGTVAAPASVRHGPPTVGARNVRRTPPVLPPGRLSLGPAGMLTSGRSPPPPTHRGGTDPESARWQERIPKRTQRNQGDRIELGLIGLDWIGLDDDD